MSENIEGAQPNLIGITADLISAYLSNNHVAPSDLPTLITKVHASLTGLSGSAPEASGPEKPTPAEIKKSITHDHIVSFEDGKPYKTLRRHLTLRGLSPEAYREKWGLPRDYPMTSAAYSAQRSDLARRLGLGQQRRQYAASSEPVDAKPTSITRPRGRRKTAEPAEA